MSMILNTCKSRIPKSIKPHHVTPIELAQKKRRAFMSYKRSIKHTVYSCTVQGVKEHLSRIGSSQCPEFFLSNLLRSVDRVLSVEPDNREFKDYKRLILMWEKEMSSEG